MEAQAVRLLVRGELTTTTSGWVLRPSRPEGDTYEVQLRAR
jgi:hypothetical protein